MPQVAKHIWAALLLGAASSLPLPAQNADQSGQAQAVNEQPADEQKIQQQLQAISQQLQQLSAARVEHSGRLDKLQSELAENAQSIRKTTIELDKTNAELRQLQDQIQHLRVQESEQSTQLEQQLDAFSQQVVNAYQHGPHSRLKLLLNLEEPSASSRLLAYQNYLARQRAAIINSISAQQARLQNTRHELQQGELQLTAQGNQQQQILDGLQQQREFGQSLRAAIADQLQDIDLQLLELQQNQQQLEQLLASIRDVFADIPEQLSAVDFAGLRGQLPWPVQSSSGRHTTRLGFGDQRQAGMRSTGIFIDAAPGQPVFASARGRVVFADWLRGYGWLIILDHGHDYLSLYGNNTQLLHEVGNWVNQGQQIAISGEGFGAEMRSGVYFELRHAGEAFNPRPWLQE